MFWSEIPLITFPILVCLHESSPASRRFSLNSRRQIIPSPNWVLYILNEERTYEIPPLGSHSFGWGNSARPTQDDLACGKRATRIACLTGAQSAMVTCYVKSPSGAKSINQTGRCRHLHANTCRLFDANRLATPPHTGDQFHGTYFHEHTGKFTACPKATQLNVTLIYIFFLSHAGALWFVSLCNRRAEQERRISTENRVRTKPLTELVQPIGTCGNSNIYDYFTFQVNNGADSTDYEAGPVFCSHFSSMEMWSSTRLPHR